MKSFIFLLIIFFGVVVGGTEKIFALEQQVLKHLTKSDAPPPVEDIKSALEVLEDKTKREALIKTLRGLTAVQEASAPAKQTGVTKTFDNFSDQILYFIGNFHKLLEDLTIAAHNLKTWAVMRQVLELLTCLFFYVFGSFLLEKLILKIKDSFLLYFSKIQLTESLNRIWWVGATLCSTLICATLVMVFSREVTEIQFPLTMFVQTFLSIRLVTIVLRQLLFEKFSATHKDLGLLDNQRSNYRRIAFFAWFIGGLVFLAALLKAMGLEPSSFQFMIQIIQQLTLICIAVIGWELRYAKNLNFNFWVHLKAKTPYFLVPLEKVLFKNLHYLVTGVVFFILYNGIQIFYAIYNPLQTIFLTILTLILWSAGRYWIGRLNHILMRKKKNQSILIASIAQAHNLVVITLHGLWHTLIFIVLLNLLGVDIVSRISDSTLQPYMRRALSLLMIFIVLRLLWTSIDHIIDQKLKTKKIEGVAIEPTQFMKTMAPIFRSLIHWVLIILTGILTLEEVGMPVLPIFYGVGFLGIALSLGAQSLVKDFINGFFTLMEGNISVGEVVILGGSTGTVESLSLRGVTLRHGDGCLQTIPFSEVKNIVNKSRDYTIVTVELCVSIRTDLKTVDALLQKTYEDMLVNPSFPDYVLSPLYIRGIDKITDQTANVVGSIRIKPDPSSYFLKAFNKQLKNNIENYDMLPGFTVSGPCPVTFKV